MHPNPPSEFLPAPICNQSADNQSVNEANEVIHTANASSSVIRSKCGSAVSRVQLITRTFLRAAYCHACLNFGPHFGKDFALPSGDG